ncbi:MAG: nucleotidyltransferase family protein [Bacteroidetes bacterium]|nr:nucleotidyltransferase family protein [Bacteroidota bacterium]
MEVIILAGGLGTRLQGVVKDIPKPMADINGKPFLKYLLDYLSKYKIERVILSVGFKYEVIEQYFGRKYKNIDLLYAIEEEPLGTGGGIMNACKLLNSNLFYLINGDTFFDVNLDELTTFHKLQHADFTLAVKPMQHFDRYGTVELANKRIIQFNEKKYMNEGFINGGVYILDNIILQSLNFPQKFSFEKDFLESYLAKYYFAAYVTDKYFIDIGIPEDYLLAQKQL